PLTVVIPTLNEEKQIAAALEALRWADEVIVADGGSSDRTAELARSHGADVIEVRGESIGLQRNAAIARARNEWVLALDADERVTEALRVRLFLVRELARRALRAGDVVAHRLRRVPQVRLPLGARPNAVGAARRLNHGGGSGPRCGFRF